MAIFKVSARDGSVSLVIRARCISCARQIAAERSPADEFAITLAVSILISLVVSLTLTPMMCARMLPALQHEAQAKGGFIVHGKRRLRFADLAVEAAAFDPPDPPVLRPEPARERYRRNGRCGCGRTEDRPGPAVERRIL